MSKIKFISQWSSTDVYFISEKDMGDLDYIIPYEVMFNDDEDEIDGKHQYRSDEMKALDECLINWDPDEFVRLFIIYQEDIGNWYCTCD